MKAKMRPHNVPSKGFANANKLAREFVTEELQRTRSAINKRCMLAVALALRDIGGYGQKRVDRIICGADELIRGYMDEYLSDEERGVEAIEKTNAAMAEELANSGRGIRLEKYFK